jgi:hypothetical protein
MGFIERIGSVGVEGKGVRMRGWWWVNKWGGGLRPTEDRAA